MSLPPITKSMHSRKTRGAYRGFRSREQWKPWRGWNYHVSTNPLEWFGHKRFVLGTVVLAVVLGGMVLAQGPLFHSQETNPAYVGNDPLTRVWDLSCAQCNNNLPDLNVYSGTHGGLIRFLAGGGSNCYTAFPSIPCLDMGSDGVS